MIKNGCKMDSVSINCLALDQIALIETVAANNKAGRANCK